MRLEDFEVDLDQVTVPILSQQELLDNSLLRWTVAIGLAIGVALLTRLAKGIVAKRLRAVAKLTSTHLDDAWIGVLDATAWFSYLALGMVAGRLALDLQDNANTVFKAGLAVLVGIQAALWAQAVLAVIVRSWAGRHDNAHAKTAVGATRFIGRLVIWSTVTLVVMSNLGIELTAIVAGLGVGGVAAALAVQSLLGDMFAGLTMFFDRPFDLGDFIIVGDVLGNVTAIGLRTTKIDSLGGEKVVYPNGKLAKNYVRNYARMEKRRIVFEFGIEYNVPAEKIETAQRLAREIVESQVDAQFDRAHFKSFGAYSLDFEVVYFVKSGDYNVYMDVQHAINFELYRRFAEAEIPFAFPTRTIYTRSETASAEEVPSSRKMARDAD